MSYLVSSTSKRADRLLGCKTTHLHNRSTDPAFDLSLKELAFSANSENSQGATSLLPFDFSMAFFFLSRGNEKNVHPAGYTVYVKNSKLLLSDQKQVTLFRFLLMLRFFSLSYFSPSPAYMCLTHYCKVSPLRTSL